MLFETYITVFACIGLLTIVSSFVITRLGLKSEYEQMVKFDISVEDMRKQEKRVSEFLEVNRLKKNADIEEIANVLKVTVAGEKRKLSNQADLSEPDEYGNRTVTFKKGLTMEKKNFVYAHECAHLINKDMSPHTRPEGYNKPYVEQLADYTAAALLMPEDEVYRYLEENNYRNLSSGKRVAVIRSLCRKHKVNEVIVLRRVKEIYKLKQLELKLQDI